MLVTCPGGWAEATQPKASEQEEEEGEQEEAKERQVEVGDPLLFSCVTAACLSRSEELGSYSDQTDEDVFSNHGSEGSTEIKYVFKAFTSMIL